MGIIREFYDMNGDLHFIEAKNFDDMESKMVAIDKSIVRHGKVKPNKVKPDYMMYIQFVLSILFVVLLFALD